MMLCRCVYRIVGNFDGGNIDGWSLRQPVFAMLLNVERENFDRSLAKCQIRQYFPPSKFPAIWYVHTPTLVAYEVVDSTLIWGFAEFKIMVCHICHFLTHFQFGWTYLLHIAKGEANDSV